LELNGTPVGNDTLTVATGLGYSHFTAMQVRDGRTRGLDLHLARLDAANRELFGRPIDTARVCGYIRHALGDHTRDASVRVYVFQPDPAADVSIVVTVRDPADPPDTAQRVRAVRYQRPVAHLKHSGGFAQEYWRRQVRAEGFDEALLTDADGVISEGAITNVACWNGSALVWPDAPALAGITMRVLQRALAERGIHPRHRTIRVSDLPSYAAVFLTNSHGIAAVDRVDDVPLPVAPDILTMLTDTYDSVPWQPI
jgi:branched-subunit amino acid aminotransferase/4-amino-4-deoxychorismate lyase